MEVFCGNSQRVKAVGCFRRETLWLMFRGVLNATLPVEKVSNIAFTQGNLDPPPLSLPYNLFDLHQMKKEEDENLD